MSHLGRGSRGCFRSENLTVSCEWQHRSGSVSFAPTH